jgi:hypothetical protein
VRYSAAMACPSPRDAPTIRTVGVLAMTPR